MLLVRKTLTEILIEVTDEKIQEISSETLSKYRKKGIGANYENFKEILFSPAKFEANFVR
jgi:Arginine/serine-rich protein PNISR